MNAAPLVSIVTPFYNTCEFLSECIESVLKQTYEHWEYILVDNCSTDGSTEIAQSYVARFPDKIRCIRTNVFLSQVQNYNFALSQISDSATYCKIVQADDWIYPECVERMVSLAETDSSIGVVSAYSLCNEQVMCQCLPYNVSTVNGIEMCRLVLTSDGSSPFGSPTSVLYRADTIRSTPQFFEEGPPYEDTEAVYHILKTWNFGFVHQVLSFWRSGNDSITSRAQAWSPDFLDCFIQKQKFSPVFFEKREALRLMTSARAVYYRSLARRIIARRQIAFLQYHRRALEGSGISFDQRALLKHVVVQLLLLLLSPGTAIALLWKQAARRWQLDYGVQTQRQW